MEYRYQSTFKAFAKVVSPTEEDRFIAKASLAPLKKLLPSDIDPAESPDLLFFTCNGAVAGLVNKNGDAISCDTGLAIYNTAKNKYVSTDHDRDKVVGVVLYPGLSKFGSNETITFDEASAAQEPFNMAFVGVLWKVINPFLTKYLTNEGGIGEEALSMSWEIAFNSYSIGIGSRNLFDAKIIKSDDPLFEAYDRYLRVNKGEGKDPSGKEVFRVIGSDSVILGYSIVPNPAAEVKGIIPIESVSHDEQDDAADSFSQIPVSQRAFLEEETTSGLGFHTCDITMEDGVVHAGVPVLNCRYIPKQIDGTKIASIAICQKNEEKIITSSYTSVNLNTAKIMKITNLQEFESALAKFESKAGEAAAAVDFVKEIQKASEKYVADLEKQENLVKNAEEAKAASEKRAKELEASINTLKSELSEIKANAEAIEIANKFQERMASFDEIFNLDSEDVKLIASDIKNLDDEGFASYLTKSKKLMAAKVKKAAKKGIEDDSSFNSDDDKEDEDDSRASKQHKGEEDHTDEEDHDGNDVHHKDEDKKDDDNGVDGGHDEHGRLPNPVKAGKKKDDDEEESDSCNAADKSKKNKTKRDGKTKDHDDKGKDGDDDDQDGDEDDGEKDGKKQSGDKASKATKKAEKMIKAALASIIENKGESFVRDDVQTDTDVVAQMAEVFGQSLKLDGKSVISAKKNK